MDENRYGVAYNMMKNMGWSEGRGLGANEDGMKEPVKVRPKNNVTGVGFKDNSDNNWLEHQDEFNALLCSLNRNSKSVTPVTKINSLEAKSRSSRSRVHYCRYTRGKDLSSCSENDLVSILGKRKHEDFITKIHETRTAYSQGEFLKDQSNQPDSHNSLKKRNKKERKEANCEVSDNVVIDSQDDPDVGLVEHASKKKHKEGKMIKNGKKVKASADIECEQSSEEQAAIEQTQLKKEKRAKKRASENVEVELNVPTSDKKHKRNKRIKQDEEEERSPDETETDVQSELLDARSDVIETVLLKKEKRAKKLMRAAKVEVELDSSVSEKEGEPSSEEQAASEPTQLKKEKRAKKMASENVEVELDVPTSEKKHKRNKRIKQDEKGVRSPDETQTDVQSELLNEECAVIETSPLKKEKRAKKMIKTTKDEVELDSSTSEKECSKNTNIKKGQEDKTTLAKAQAGLEREILNKEKNNIGSAERGKKKGEEIQVINLTEDVSLDKRRFTLRLLDNYFKSETDIANREKYTTLLFELMNVEMFVGSNFFSLQGYEE